MGHGHAFGERPVAGEPRQNLRRTDGLVPGPAIAAAPAGEDEGRDHPVAHAPAPHLGAGRDDDAAIFVARHMGQRHRIGAGPDVPVRAADPAGQNLENHAVPRTIGLGHGADLEGRAPARQPGGPHQPISTR